MKRRILCLLAAIPVVTILVVVVWTGFIVLSLRAATVPPRPDRAVVLRNIELVVPGGMRLSRRTVVIREGRIQEIRGAGHGEGGPMAGAYVLPGLNDLHVHWPPQQIPGQIELFSLLHLLHGVTGVRSMGDAFPGSSQQARDGIEAGRFPGPLVRTCGPFVDGDPPLWRSSLVVADPGDAGAVVQELVEAGFDCVKIYDGLDEQTAVSLREAAHAAGLPAVGHVPRGARFDVVRLDDVQHLRGMHPRLHAVAPPHPQFLAAWLEADADHMARIRDESLRLGIAHTPTLIAIERMVLSEHYAEMIEDPAYRLLPRWYRDGLWDAQRGMNPARRMNDADFEMVRAALLEMKEAVRVLYRGGVEIHTGTDTMAPAVVPGAGLHRELELLVESGLSAEQALAASTKTSATALGVPRLGELRVGAPAELAIFRRDPTRDLAALSTLIGVVRGGQLYTREDLERRLERHRSLFEGFGQRVVLTEMLRLAFGHALPLLFAPDVPSHE